MRAAVALVLALSAAIAVLVFGPSGAVTSDDALEQLPDGAQSTQVARQQAELPVPPALPAIAVFTRDGGPLREADTRFVDSLTRRAQQLAAPGTTVTSERAPGDALATLSVPLSTSLDDEAVVEQVKRLRELVRADLPAGLDVAVTGAPAFSADLAGVFEGADATLLLATAGVVALLLLVTYRSPVLWLIPLVAVGLGDRVAAGVVGALAQGLDLQVDAAASGILSVLVFGAGTDYALLLVSRYRDELRRHPDRFTAMAATLRTTAPAVLASAGTVALALLTLLVSDVPATRGLGFACAVGIGVAAVAGLVLLPALLVLPGRWLFWPFVPRVGEPLTVDRAGRWSRIGTAVVGRPLPVLALAAVVVLALGSGLLGVRTGLSPAEQFRATPEAVVGQERLAAALPGGATQPLTITATADSARDVVAAAQASPGVASARVAFRPDDVVVVEAVLTAAPGSADSDRALGALRERLTGLPDADAAVGGQTAEAYDLARAADRDTRTAVPLVLLVVLGVLVVLLRALVAPVLLVATVVATWAAALGAGWLIFDRLYGFAALDTGVPLLSFLFLVALGVDYNIFLVTRAREEVRQGRRTVDGTVRALAATGGVITSAGVLLAAVFAVLGVLPVIALTQLGVIVGLGVLLDTLLIRTLVVPALTAVTGRTFWWPSALDRAPYAPPPAVHRDGHLEPAGQA